MHTHTLRAIIIVISMGFMKIIFPRNSISIINSKWFCTCMCHGRLRSAFTSCHFFIFPFIQWVLFIWKYGFIYDDTKVHSMQNESTTSLSSNPHNDFVLWWHFPWENRVCETFKDFLSFYSLRSQFAVHITETINNGRKKNKSFILSYFYFVYSAHANVCILLVQCFQRKISVIFFRRPQNAYYLYRTERTAYWKA